MTGQTLSTMAAFGNAEESNAEFIENKLSYYGMYGSHDEIS